MWLIAGNIEIFFRMICSQNASLKELYLPSNKIGDAGAVSICDAVAYVIFAWTGTSLFFFPPPCHPIYLDWYIYRAIIDVFCWFSVPTRRWSRLTCPTIPWTMQRARRLNSSLFCAKCATPRSLWLTPLTRVSTTRTLSRLVKGCGPCSYGVFYFIQKYCFARTIHFLGGANLFFVVAHDIITQRILLKLICVSFAAQTRRCRR